ncbi:MAG: acetate--CoA ligase family protein [Actinomycetota bacterium]|nr:acetate--CoA ligase family protein [Actinomycetota bacterium]
MSDLRFFFHPRAIAVIGATDDKTKPGYHLLKKVMERAARDGGSVYPVNPRTAEIVGVKCYPTLAAVPGDLDVVVVMIGDAEQGLRDAVAKKATFCIIFTAGFSEIGAEGAARERELSRIAAEGGVRLFGPNTNVNAFELFPDLPGKKIGLITQSGHQGRPIAQGVDLGIGLSYWAPTGNEADLEAADFIEYYVTHEDTGVIAAYIEGFKSIPRLRVAAEKAARAQKPIVLVKVGRTNAGARMAMSHTGHLTGADDVHDAFFKQYGIVRVDDLDELLETSALLARLPKPPGDGVCIYAISGGTGAHMADMCEWAGLRLPPLMNETQNQLHTLIPDYLTVSNPVDNGAQPVRKPGQNRWLIEQCLDDPSCDILVCPITGVLPSMSKIVATDIVDAYKSAKKPVIVIWGSPVVDEDGYRILVEGGVPMFRSFRSCVIGIRRYLDYWKFIDSFEERTAPDVSAGAELPEGSGPLSEDEAATIAEHFGIPFARRALVEGGIEAGMAAGELGPTVVMKACGRGILHKSDAGLVRVGVSPDEAGPLFDELDKLGREYAGDGGYDGVLVEEMVDDGEEVIVGVKNDPQFGPVIVFGLGGVFVEVMRDVSRRVVPLTRGEAEAMIREVRGFPLLDGARGRPKADIDALADLLMNVSHMATALGNRLQELDLNPVRVLPAGHGVIALDALLIRS